MPYTLINADAEREAIRLDSNIRSYENHDRLRDFLVDEIDLTDTLIEKLELVSAATKDDALNLDSPRIVLGNEANLTEEQLNQQDLWFVVHYHRIRSGAQ
jgi:hypothetical protein